MLYQEQIIKTVTLKSKLDEKISACMMYGSFTKGEGDQFSDVEFYVFVKEEQFSSFDSSHWINEIAPNDLLLENEYGTEVVIFTHLVRGEFHFLPESKMDIIESFKPTGVFPNTDSMFIYDRTGKLKPLLKFLGGSGPYRSTNENVNYAFNCIMIIKLLNFDY
ncbi:hypothetical protein [Cytobacillus purgationiresistens]|uniref:Nucleotidyltransferase n=1 Tax=Cytobacillus purgationiresistens TaxID=863449 RepID=A0ABU0AJ53_9BACI|nr:hypothetical protein [Cytobacillus purgationiresistens]MDQ0271286.1 putative nucleotidyltransferase [Cytobacillus purgationiresistens]